MVDVGREENAKCVFHVFIANTDFLVVLVMMPGEIINLKVNNPDGVLVDRKEVHTGPTLYKMKAEIIPLGRTRTLGNWTVEVHQDKPKLMDSD